MTGDDASFWEAASPKGVNELLIRARKLQLIAGMRAANLTKGDYITRIPGDGLEFLEARKYVYGESIRQIDWNITARMRSPYVRVYQEEREREIFIVLDVSPTMHAGWQSRRKIEYAVELAATIATSVISAGDSLGYATYSDVVRDFSRPTKGPVQLFRTVKALYTAAITAPARCAVSDMRQAIARIQRARGENFVIFFLSDFMDFDVPEDLRYLQARHEVVLVHVYDPLEYEVIPGVSFLARSPEGAAGLSASRTGAAGPVSTVKEYLRAEARKHDIRFASVSTTMPMGQSLDELFYQMRTYRMGGAG
jgi:uncharacterized protein (DUF58 family)